MAKECASESGRRGRGRSPTARRRRAICRLQRMRITKTLRSSGMAAANNKLAALAGETIGMVEQRIQYWMQVGDLEHVRRLQALRDQLIATYHKPVD